MAANTFLKRKHPLKFNKGQQKNTRATNLDAEAEGPAEAVTRMQTRDRSVQLLPCSDMMGEWE